MHQQDQEGPDGALADRVKEALLTQTESAGIEVKVSADRGVVRLSGVVDALSHAEACERIAWNVDGVARVENDITVGMEGEYGDKHIENELTGRLTEHPRTRQVGCGVHRGKVLLVGHVATKADRAFAAELAAKTRGVRGVETRGIKVGEGRDDDDAAVTRAVEGQLRAVGLGEHDFEAYTSEGVVYLKGFVADDGQRQRIISLVRRLDGVARVEATLVTRDQMLH